MERLPMPRLQFTWRRPTASEAKRKRPLGHPDWVCDYELILPLNEADIRRKAKRDYMALKLGGTFIQSSATEKTEDTPFRDGAHASWDSEVLGGLPVYVVGSDGVARQRVQHGDGWKYVEKKAA